MKKQICEINANDDSRRVTILFDDRAHLLVTSDADYIETPAIPDIDAARDMARKLYPDLSVWDRRDYYYCIWDDCGDLDFYPIDAADDADAAGTGKLIWSRLSDHDKRRRGGYQVIYTVDDDDGCPNTDLADIILRIK